MSDRVTYFQPRLLSCAHGRMLTLGPKGVLMAIVNVTPNSFSDGGQFGNVGETVSFCLQAVKNGASILDIGGESTRPGAVAISADEEQARVIPVIRALCAQTNTLISIDTYRAETARRAIEEGAHIVNDVTGGTGDPGMFNTVFDTGAAYCLMHTNRGRDTLVPPLDDQLLFIKSMLTAARTTGIQNQKLVIDPGFGFGKNTNDNLEIMANLSELHVFGLPILIGTSRKRFVAAVGGGEDNLARDFATVATTVLMRQAGGSIFRVHNILANGAAIAFADQMIAKQYGAPL